MIFGSKIAATLEEWEKKWLEGEGEKCRMREVEGKTQSGYYAPHLARFQHGACKCHRIPAEMLFSTASKDEVR